MNARLLCALAAFALCTSTTLADATYTNEAAFLSALGQSATTITFDDLPHDTQLSAQYAGVNFGHTGRTWDALNYGGGGTYDTPHNVLFNYAGPGGAPTPVVMDFTTPVMGVGVYNPSMYDCVQLQYFGAGDQLLATRVAQSFGFGVTYVGYMADEPITRIKAIGIEPQTCGTIFLDTMSFAPVPVPEPGTLSLLALGGLALARRR